MRKKISLVNITIVLATRFVTRLDLIKKHIEHQNTYGVCSLMDKASDF